MVKGGIQVRKQWESSALLLSESKVPLGSSVSWQRSGRATSDRRERMLGCAALAGSAAAAERGSLEHKLQGWGSTRPWRGW